MMSLSFMIRYSTPSILTSVPDHLPNSTRSPALTSIGISLPASSRPPGPTATISPCCGFSLAVSNDDPSRGFFLGVNALDDDTVVKRTELHRHPPKFLIKLRFWRCMDGRKGSPTPSGGDIGAARAAFKRPC